jgi:hypothetical protein
LSNRPRRARTSVIPTKGTITTASTVRQEDREVRRPHRAPAAELTEPTK